jgi:hypothetical protein
VSAVEVMNLKFYPEYHWAVDYTLYATVVYTLTEVGDCSVFVLN